MKHLSLALVTLGLTGGVATGAWLFHQPAVLWGLAPIGFFYYLTASDLAGHGEKE